MRAFKVMPKALRILAKKLTHLACNSRIDHSLLTKSWLCETFYHKAILESNRNIFNSNMDFISLPTFGIRQQNIPNIYVSRNGEHAAYWTTFHSPAIAWRHFKTYDTLSYFRYRKHADGFAGILFWRQIDSRRIYSLRLDKQTIRTECTHNIIKRARPPSAGTDNRKHNRDLRRWIAAAVLPGSPHHRNIRTCRKLWCDASCLACSKRMHLPCTCLFGNRK